MRRTGWGRIASSLANSLTPSKCYNYQHAESTRLCFQHLTGVPSWTGIGFVFFCSHLFLVGYVVPAARPTVILALAQFTLFTLALHSFKVSSFSFETPVQMIPHPRREALNFYCSVLFSALVNFGPTCGCQHDIPVLGVVFCNPTRQVESFTAPCDFPHASICGKSWWKVAGEVKQTLEGDRMSRSLHWPDATDLWEQGSAQLPC